MSAQRVTTQRVTKGIAASLLATMTMVTVAARAENPIEIELADEPMFQRLSAQLEKNATVELKSNDMHFAQLPAGLKIPVRLVTNTDNVKLAVGTRVEGRTTRNIELPAKDILPAGTKVSGIIKSVKKGSGEPAILQITFDSMTLSSGTEFPIASRVSPLTTNDLRNSTELQLRLTNKAQLAVTGTVL